jgi:hypothetical protein
MGEQLLYGPNQVAEFPQAGPQYANDATPKNIPGRIIQYKGKKYRYVQFDNGAAVTPLASGVVYWKELDPSTGIFIVTADETDTLAQINGVAGVLELVDIPTDQYYTWIEVGGVVDALVADSTVAGDKCIGSTADQTFGRIAAGAAVTDNVFGIALDAKDTAGTSKVLLQNLEW